MLNFFHFIQCYNELKKIIIKKKSEDPELEINETKQKYI